MTATGQPPSRSLPAGGDVLATVGRRAAAVGATVGTALGNVLGALAGRLPRPWRRDRPRRRSSAVRRAVWGLVASVALVGGLFAFVFPTRTYLAQRAAEATAEERLAVLTERNEALEQRAAELRTPEEIERIARRDYGLVRPGEEAYAILPPPAPPVDLPDVWPFARLGRRLAPTQPAP